MDSILTDLEELRRQLGNGSIQRAYRALLAYLMDLRTHFVNKYGDPAVSTLYQGYMDMSYFAIFPPSLKPLDLKVAIVFNYAAFRFEAWLTARNRKIQRQYWELFKESHWVGYRVLTPAGGIDSIVECDLARDIDFNDPGALTSRIETGVEAFIDKIESFRAEQQTGPA